MIETFNAVMSVFGGPVLIGMAVTFALTNRPPVMIGVYVTLGLLGFVSLAIRLAA